MAPATALVAGLDEAKRRLAIGAIEKFDRMLAAEDAILSIGPILAVVRFNLGLGAWTAASAPQSKR